VHSACYTLSSVACPAVTYFSTLDYVIRDTIYVKKKVPENRMCILIHSENLCETFVSLRRTERDTIQNAY